MRKSIFALILIYILIPLLGLNAQTISNEEQPKPITIYQAQVSGVSEDVVSIVYKEGVKKVYDPVIITPETEIWSGKKQVALKTIKVKQYLTVTAVREGDELVAQKIDIGYKPLPKKKVVTKPKATSKVVAKPAPVRAATKK